MYNYEFDSANHVLHLLYRRHVDEETLRRSCIDTAHTIAVTGAKYLIEDFSAVEHFSASADAVRHLGEAPPGGEDLKTIRVIVAPKLQIFGLARLFEAHATDAMPKVAVVRLLDEAFAFLEIKNPRFVPVEPQPDSSAGSDLFI